METTEKIVKHTHHGHAVKRLRKALNIKQENIALSLGISQQAVSLYEQKPVIEDDILDKIAEVLKVDPQLIKELEVDPVSVIIENNNNTFGDYDKINMGYNIEDNSSNTYNPVDKIVELCEKLLKADQEKIKLLEQLLNNRK